MHNGRHTTGPTHRRTRVAELYLKGWTQTKIAQHIGFSIATVSLDLKRIRKEWRETYKEDFAKRQARELAKIDRLEREYWEAWERSIGINETRTVKNGKDGTEETVKQQDLVGDPRFLDGIAKCIDRRCKILGIDAPTKIEVNDLTVRGVDFSPESLHEQRN